MRLRRTAEENSATSPDAPPRFTSRPYGASTRDAAVAATPNTGSTTTSTAPPQRPWRRAVSASTSRIEPDDLVGAGAACPLLRLRRPADGDHPAGAEQLRRGHGHLPHGAPGAEDEHPLPRRPAAPER